MVPTCLHVCLFVCVSSGLPSSLVRAQPGSEEFLEVLKRIDQAIEFFLQVRNTWIYRSERCFAFWPLIELEQSHDLNDFV